MWGLRSRKIKKGKLVCHYSPRSFPCQQGIMKKMRRFLFNVPRLGDPGDIDPLLIELLNHATRETLQSVYVVYTPLLQPGDAPDRDNQPDSLQGR